MEERRLNLPNVDFRGIWDLYLGNFLSDKILFQLLISGLFGGAFILLNVFTGISIGFPLLPYATTGDRFLISGAVAPPMEEFAFRIFLPIILTMFFCLLGISLFYAVFFSGAISVFAFSAYHWYAYGASLQAMNASYIGAVIFGIVAMGITLWQKSPIPAIVIHAIFNIWLLSRLYFAFTVAVPGVV